MAERARASEPWWRVRGERAAAGALERGVWECGNGRNGRAGLIALDSTPDGRSERTVAVEWVDGREGVREVGWTMRTKYYTAPLSFSVVRGDFAEQRSLVQELLDGSEAVFEVLDPAMVRADGAEWCVGCGGARALRSRYCVCRTLARGARVWAW